MPRLRPSFVTGRAVGAAGGRAGRRAGAAAADGPWPRADQLSGHAAAGSSLGAPLQPVLLLLDADSGPGYLRDWRPPGISPDRNFSYAVQWWSFALLALAMFVGLNLKKTPCLIPPMPRSPRQRRMLLLLVALFFVPIAASFILYYGVGWRPAGGTNHGELYSPARPLPASTAPLADKKWALVYAGDGACDEDCRRSLVFARQTRLSLNQEMTRVKRVFLATGNCCDRDYLDDEHAGLVVLDAGADPRLAAVVAALPATDRQHSLFIVDPLGNLVMRYDTRTDPRGLLDDLKKLLKLSHIG